MEVYPIDAYHITNRFNITSIAKYGLIPDYGKNSRTKREQRPLLFFTTFDCLDTWRERFDMRRENIVILKFICNTKYNERYDSANDFFINYRIPSKDISVITKEGEIPLLTYYQTNKEKFDLEATKKACEIFKEVTDRLKQIKLTPLTPEKDWDYKETEPNLVSTIDALKYIISLDDKKQFSNIVKSIKKKTLKRLLKNDLEITEKSAIYKTLEITFDDCISNKPKLDIANLTSATNLISINMQYRQLARYNRTLKKYGDDYTIWEYDDMYLQPIIKNIANISYLTALLEETTTLHIRNKKEIISENKRQERNLVKK